MEELIANILNHYYTDHRHGRELLTMDIQDLLNKQEKEYKKYIEDLESQIYCLEVDIESLENEYC